MSSLFCNFWVLWQPTATKLCAEGLLLFTAAQAAAATGLSPCPLLQPTDPVPVTQLESKKESVDKPGSSTEIQSAAEHEVDLGMAEVSVSTNRKVQHDSS